MEISRSILMDFHFHRYLKLGIPLLIFIGFCYSFRGTSSTMEVGKINSNFDPACSYGDASHCLQKYIMKSYFQKYEILDETDFEEFVYTGLPYALCEFIQSVPNLPILSVSQRLLIGEGSHRLLSSSIKIQLEPSSISQLSQHICKVVVVERLPNGVFADPFELQHLLNRGAFTDVAVFGDMNLELPSVLSNRSAVEVHIDVSSNMFLDNKTQLEISIQLPLHVRYPPIGEIGYSTIKFGEPDLYLQCRVQNNLHNHCCLLIQTADDRVTGPVVVWRVPSGIIAHTRLVSLVTFASASVSTILIVFASLYCSNTVKSKTVKVY